MKLDIIQSMYLKASTEIPPGSPEAASKATTQNDDVFTLSGPKPYEGSIAAHGSGNFYLYGWYASDKAKEVTATIYGETFQARYTVRKDAAEKFPDYRYTVGWVFEIPVPAFGDTFPVSLNFDGTSMKTYTLKAW